MGIKTISGFSYRAPYYLDDRQGLAKSKSDLLEWSTSIPEGFEVFCESEWYVYSSTNTEDPEIGFFKRREQSVSDLEEKIAGDIDELESHFEGQLESTKGELETSINNLNTTLTSDINALDTKITEEISTLGDSLGDVGGVTEDLEQKVSDRVESLVADTAADLLSTSNWTKNGELYVYNGIVVTVINDGENNGVYRLQGESYTLSSNWIKILDLSNLVKSGTVIESSDNSVYTTAKADEVFATPSSIPTVLPNPYALSINGTVYDGSSEVNMATLASTQNIDLSSFNGDLLTGTIDSEFYDTLNGYTENANSIQVNGYISSDDEKIVVPVTLMSEDGELVLAFDLDLLTINTGTTRLLTTRVITIQADYSWSGQDKEVISSGSGEFTEAERSKLESIESGAEVNVQPDWNETDTESDAYIVNKPEIPNTDNFITEDTLESALNNSGYASTSYVDNAVADLASTSYVDTAIGDIDTILDSIITQQNTI